jgi:hypothetical protein
LAVCFLLLFPCLLRLSALFPERAIGAPADLDSHARRLREWSLGLKIPIVVGAIVAVGLGIGIVFPSVAVAGVWIAIGIFLGAIGLNFYAAARAADRAARARIGWTGALVVTLLVLPVVSLYASGSSSALWSTGLFLSIPLFATSLLSFVVVFGAGAIDPRLAIHRTALFSILALGGVFGFGVIETAVTDYLIATAGLPQGTGAMIAGGIMAVTFKPAHGFIENMLNRVLGAAEA